jgi:tetratricopeptide (TPR) repeat protein
MHTPRQVLKGIALPSELVAVTGRVYNWLSDASDDIEPVSCWVLSCEGRNRINLADVFKLIGWKLQANAGVNLCLEGLDDILNDMQAFNTSTNLAKITFDFSGTNREADFLVADSLRLLSPTSKAKFPNHISIFDAWLKIWEIYQGNKAGNYVFSFADVRDADDYSSGKKSFIEICELILEFCKIPNLENFLVIISTINGTIKRGGFRKHGAITTSLNTASPLLNEYLDIPFGYLPYIKKSVDFSSGESFDKENQRNILPNSRALIKILEKYNKGELFFEKALGVNKSGVKIRSNVCRGIGLVPDDQCLITHVNLGKVKHFEDIVRGYKDAAKFILNVFKLQQELGFKNVDNQVAIGVIGLANLLRNFQISYQTFVDALVINSEYGLTPNNWQTATLGNDEMYRARELAYYWLEGMKAAAKICKRAGMRACLTIEPSESCARRYKDYKGFDVVPNIDPPDVVAGIGVQHRHGTVLKDFQGNDMENVYNFGADIEVATQINYHIHFSLWEEVQKMMDSTKMAHMACYEHWNFDSEPLSVSKFIDWYQSKKKTLYYYRNIGTKHLIKGKNVSNARAYFNQAVNNDQTNAQENTACSINNPIGCESCSD